MAQDKVAEPVETTYAENGRKYIDGTFYRYLAVGVSNTALSYCVFWLCLQNPITFPLKTSASQLVSYGFGTLWSFFWNRRLTFKSNGNAFKQAGKFVPLQATMALTSAALVGFAVDTLGFPPTPSWIVIISAVAIVNFTLCKSWAFK